MPKNGDEDDLLGLKNLGNNLFNSKDPWEVAIPLFILFSFLFIAISNIVTFLA